MANTSGRRSTSPVQIIEHTTQVPPLEDLVRDESGKPVFTEISHGLQATNMRTLWELFQKLRGTGYQLPEKGGILDAGCGDGLLFALAPHMMFPEIGIRPIIGVDLTPSKIARARRVANLVSEHYRQEHGRSLIYDVTDAQDIAELDTSTLHISGEERGFPRVGMVFSNSMFHWIKDPKAKRAALRNFRTVMKDGGALCLSMSASGTAKDFLHAYQKTMDRGVGPYDVVRKPDGYYSDLYEADPIGSQNLDYIADMIRQSGFDIVASLTLAESVRYKHPTEYSDAVEIYGRKAFLNPVSHLGHRKQDAVWGMIVDEFLEVLKQRHGWSEGSPYTYEQYNNYFLAVKRGADRSAEEERHIEYAGSTLNEKFLQFGLGPILKSGVRPLGIALNGNPEELKPENAPKGIQVAVSLKNILTTVISDAAQYWDPQDTDPAVSVGYMVVEDGKVLAMAVDVRTTREQLISDLFREPDLEALADAGVKLGYSRLESGVRRYEALIPVVDSSRF